MAFPLHRSLSQQSGRSVNLRTPRCHGKEWRPLTRSNAISCYNSDLATKLRRQSASLYIGYVSRKRVGRLSTWSAVRIYVQKENAVCNFLLRSRCWEGPCASFHQKKVLVHQRVLKKSGLSQTESWRDDALLLVSKVLFLNTRCMATWRAATTAQGQFVAARTYRWCCRRLEVCWWRPFVVTAARRLTIDE